MTKENKLKVGREVFIISRQLNIDSKKIIAVIEGNEETTYKLDTFDCGGVTRKELFLTKSKAKVRKKEFTDKLKFRKGDLIIFKHKEYNNTEIEIGIIDELKYSKSPYYIKTAHNYTYDLIDTDVVLKINNSYIENYEDLKELHIKFDETKKELNYIITLMHKEHDKLEWDLKKKFKKQFAWYTISKKPKFEDRFRYESDDD